MGEGEQLVPRLEGENAGAGRTGTVNENATSLL